jgi:hypothetical protein
MVAGSARFSVSTGVRRCGADPDGQPVERGGREAERAGEVAAVRVRRAARGALPRDARVGEAQSVSAARPEPRAICGAHTSFRAPQSTAREPGIACLALRTRVARPELVAYGAFRLDACLEGVEGGHGRRVLAHAAVDACGRPIAALLAAEQDAAVRTGTACAERRAAVRVRALGALRITRVDGAGTRGSPAGVAASAAGAAADDTARTAGIGKLARRAELGRIRRVRRAGRKRDPGERRGHRRAKGSPHDPIEAPGRRGGTPARRAAGTPGRKATTPSQLRGPVAYLLLPGEGRWNGPPSEGRWDGPPTKERRDGTPARIDANALCRGVRAGDTFTSQA